MSSHSLTTVLCLSIALTISLTLPNLNFNLKSRREFLNPNLMIKAATNQNTNPTVNIPE